jgi:hypothetical protein
VSVEVRDDLLGVKAAVWAGQGRVAQEGQTEMGARRGNMLVPLVVILLVLALAGGVAVHPLLFLIALLALLVAFGGRGRTVP